VFKGEPLFRTKKEAWELFRIGPDGSYQSEPAKRVAHPGQQFPTDAFDQFMKQGVPRWTTTDAATQAAYNEFAVRFCPCVIITHSQGGNFAFNMALAHPERIKAVVAVEPSGAPDPAKADIASIKHIPHLFVWGDNLDKHPVWGRITAGPNRYRDALLKVGGKADLLDLPARGVRGNSHMLMMDRNSDQIAGMIQDWLAEQGLMK
jgi:pimeloyl-ACP methyl ester carboxylesterase